MKTSVTSTKKVNLYAKYPTLFRHAGNSALPIYFGIETGDGWYKIVCDMCRKLAKLSPHIYISQIKEKFGTLRVYIGSDYPITVRSELINKQHMRADAIIDAAERASSRTCETCGAPAKLIETDGKWLLTLCADCFKRYKMRDLPVIDKFVAGYYKKPNKRK